MNRDAMLQGLVDELEKISAFNLKGLSPETVLEKSQPPPPMETAGFNKARDILGMAAQTKTAAKKQKDERLVSRAFPTQPGMGKLVRQGDNSTNEQAKSVAGYGLAGGGAGRFAAEFAHGPKLPNAAKFHSNKWYGTAAGVGAGLGYGVYRQHQKSQLAKQGTITKTAMTPAQSLKASKQVGKVGVKPSVSGPSTTTQIRGQLIGKKGIP